MTASLLLFLALAASPETPARPAARLKYARLDATAQSCPGPSQVEAAVRTRLGYDPFRADAKDIIEVFIERNDGGLRARLQLKDTDGNMHGKRVLDSPATDCVELSSALTLGIAIAVDPQAFLGTPTPPIPVAAAAPVAPTVIDSPPPPPPLVEASSAVKFHAGVALLGLVGTSPGVSGGFAVRVGLHAERWSISLDGRAELPRAMAAGPGEVSVGHLAGLLAPCVHFLSYFGACGVVGAGVTRVTSTGLEGSRDGSSLFLQAGGRVQALFPLSPHIALGGSVDVLVPLARTILLVGDEQLWSTPPVNGNAALVVAFSFG
jgi:hypothetical protein